MLFMRVEDGGQLRHVVDVDEQVRQVEEHS